MSTKLALLLLLTCTVAPTAWAGGENTVVAANAGGDGFIWESTDDKNVIANSPPAPMPAAPKAPPTFGPVPESMHAYTSSALTMQQYWQWLLAHMMALGHSL